MFSFLVCNSSWNVQLPCACQFHLIILWVGWLSLTNTQLLDDYMPLQQPYGAWSSRWITYLELWILRNHTFATTWILWVSSKTLDPTCRSRAASLMIWERRQSTYMMSGTTTPWTLWRIRAPNSKSGSQKWLAKTVICLSSICSGGAGDEFTTAANDRSLNIYAPTWSASIIIHQST